MIIINIASDFSKTPGGREKKDGPYSGEEFREEILIKKFLQAVKEKEKLLIDFDNTYGFAPSFIEEAFGGLVRKLDLEIIKDIWDVLEFKSEDDLVILEWIKNDINNALKVKRGAK